MKNKKYHDKPKQAINT